jgi:hypothetical protein
MDAILESRGLSEGLDFHRFSVMVSTPSPIEEWARLLPSGLHRFVADAMPRNDGCLSNDQLLHLRIQEQLDLSCEVIMDHLAMILQEQLAILAWVYHKLDSHTAAINNE